MMDAQVVRGALTKYREDQARDDQGRWVDEGGGEGESNGDGRNGPDNIAEPIVVAQVDDPAPLRRMHPDTTYEQDRLAKNSLDYWRNQPTDKIIESLKPGEKEALRTYPDGTVINGNTRAKVLQERGFDINSLPREQVAPPTTLPPLKTPRGGGSGGGGPGFMPFRRPPRI